MTAAAPGTALFVSPHLDDVVFSCGGLAALLADAGWHTVLATIFTRSVVPASGFALACQLDKGLAAEIDYMALRREEDATAAAIVSFGAVEWLDMLEAPHRGYHEPAALFGDVHADDTVAGNVEAALLAVKRDCTPGLVLAPQGLGRHVDHQIVTACVQRVFDPGSIAYYRDTPYAIRQPGAAPLACVPAAPIHRVEIRAALDRKIRAACAYTTQIGYQFGDAEACATALGDFAMAEGQGVAAERFLGLALPL